MSGKSKLFIGLAGIAVTTGAVFGAMGSADAPAKAKEDTTFFGMDKLGMTHTTDVYAKENIVGARINFKNEADGDFRQSVNIVYAGGMSAVGAKEDILEAKREGAFGEDGYISYLYASSAIRDDLTTMLATEDVFRDDTVIVSLDSFKDFYNVKIGVEANSKQKDAVNVCISNNGMAVLDGMDNGFACFMSFDDYSQGTMEMMENISKPSKDTVYVYANSEELQTELSDKFGKFENFNYAMYGSTLSATYSSLTEDFGINNDLEEIGEER